MAIPISILLVALLGPVATLAISSDNGQQPPSPPPSPQVDITFAINHINMTMGNSTKLDYSIVVNESALILAQTVPTSVEIHLQPLTLSPQLDILEFEHTNSTRPQIITINYQDLKKNNFVHTATTHLRATYIGHATLQLKSYLILSVNDGAEKVNKTLTVPRGQDRLQITVTKPEGHLDKIFMYSIIVFITISYTNLGAQIDTDNVRRLIETPRTIILGFLIGITTMPLASWIAGYLFFSDQPMYRIGSFIYACGPAASASVLWTVMFDADKELSLGLQIASTFGALFTMPMLLYAMDKSMDLEGHYTIKVPYMNLARTLFVLLIALLIGSRLVSRYKRAKQISQRIFRPLTMFVLLFIIVFSSVVYSYVYKMFSWYITYMALIVTSATYLLSGLLGYIIGKDVDHMITISISSTYRNSGIAFAALTVAFQQPDIFIAYVPCLTQVVATSMIGLVLYSIKSLNNYCHKREEIDL